MNKRAKAIISVLVVLAAVGCASILYMRQNTSKDSGTQGSEIAEENKNDTNNVEDDEIIGNNEKKDNKEDTNVVDKEDNKDEAPEEDGSLDESSNSSNDSNSNQTIESSDVVSRQFYLKNGTGSLVLYNETETSYKFTISGANNGDDKKIDETTGIAEVSDGVGTYTSSNGEKITFQEITGGMIVTSYDASGNVSFQGAYLPN